MNGRRGGDELARLIERSAELKRDLVDFACSPRMRRSLAAAMREAGLAEFEEADAIGIIDRFALQHRMRDGRTVVDRFVASRPDLDAADREMLLGWRDPVEGIFEIRGQDGGAIILLNLIDDLEYRTYSNMGPAAFRPLPSGGFVLARLALRAVQARGRSALILAVVVTTVTVRNPRGRAAPPPATTRLTTAGAPHTGLVRLTAGLVLERSFAYCRRHGAAAGVRT